MKVRSNKGDGSPHVVRSNKGDGSPHVVRSAIKQISRYISDEESWKIDYRNIIPLECNAKLSIDS